MKTESQIQREICDWLKARNFFFWRNNNVPVMGRSMPKYSLKGVADILGVHKGRFFAIEVKRLGGDELQREKNGRKVRAGSLNPFQQEFAANVVFRGGEYIVARSVTDVEELMVKLNS